MHPIYNKNKTLKQTNQIRLMIGAKRLNAAAVRRAVFFPLPSVRENTGSAELRMSSDTQFAMI